ncbi:calcium-dependent protein kinase 15 isoform X1 [Arachis hypogaea]|uniref:calcium-dependent protein kinase 15 isoform X1 n=1 Tax=Arachis hypogaea TaxID=3818 RepID=UPI0034E6991F|nr:calcium-dependent protein kinase 3-like [Arachis hypogaea]
MVCEQKIKSVYLFSLLQIGPLILMRLLLGGFHEENKQGIFDAILHGRIDFSSEAWPSISSSAKNLVKTLHADAKEWLSAVEVLNQLAVLYLQHKSLVLSLRSDLLEG